MSFLGIDVGTGGTRAVLVDERGKVLVCETAEHPPFSSPEIGWAEQTPAVWWDACVLAIRRALQHISPDAVNAVSFSGQMHGAVLLDERDHPVRPALLWCDQRTVQQCVEITETVGSGRLLELVSNRAVTGLTLPKLLWVREFEPDLWARVRSILLPKDYVRLRLTGDMASDAADCSGTLLYDVRNRRWSQEMLEAFGIERTFLPEVFESVELTGRVSKQGASETGLNEGTVVVAGAGDNAAGAVGMGVTKPGSVGVTIGTSGVVFGALDQPSTDPLGRVHTFCHAVPQRWHNTGVTLAAGLSLKWFRDNLAHGEDYDTLAAQASGIPSGSDGAIWLPYLMGERTPHLDPSARGAVVGLTASHTRAHIIRAIMEGVAFSLRDSIEILKELGTPIDTIRLSGGGAKSKLWRQIQADVFGQPVDVLSADEGAAYGAALLAGVGAGAWESVDEACSSSIRVVETVEPNPSGVEISDQNYAVYVQLYRLLRQAEESALEVSLIRRV
jgi:xylulokinase